MVLAAQEEQPQLPVDGGDKLPQMDAPGGEVQGEILRLGRAAAQQRRAGIVEGIVGGVIVLHRTQERHTCSAARSKITEGFSGGAGAVSRKKLSYRERRAAADCSSRRGFAVSPGASARAARSAQGGSQRRGNSR